ncbi:hypothetical protein EDC19_0104 [Natranaerovirga hydrolytica]|uniref:Uncharacterized protein n=1 Tax=Natranaerovirga hydrolytica TaxID=680378 RepID=A0A4R1N194_9FIRM|nr:hypothetical protein [Natranaerovirga hydrolytica]TCK99484.1 hypothetical protein EDC19_0104 [Natranaerovirga hydrolytica]
MNGINVRSHHTKMANVRANILNEKNKLLRNVSNSEHYWIGLLGNVFRTGALSKKNNIVQVIDTLVREINVLNSAVNQAENQRKIAQQQNAKRLSNIGRSL